MAGSKAGGEARAESNRAQGGLGWGTGSEGPLPRAPSAFTLAAPPSTQPDSTGIDRDAEKAQTRASKCPPGAPARSLRTGTPPASRTAPGLQLERGRRPEAPTEEVRRRPRARARTSPRAQVRRVGEGWPQGLQPWTLAPEPDPKVSAGVGPLGAPESGARGSGE